MNPNNQDNTPKIRHLDISPPAPSRKPSDCGLLLKTTQKVFVTLHCDQNVLRNKINIDIQFASKGLHKMNKYFLK